MENFGDYFLFFPLTYMLFFPSFCTSGNMLVGFFFFLFPYILVIILLYLTREKEKKNSVLLVGIVEKLSHGLKK